MSSLPGRSLPSSAFILAIIALLLSALYVAGLIFDWPAWVHGSNWVWVRRVPAAGARFWLMPLALVVGLAAGAVALRGGEWSRRRTALFLGGLVLLTPLLQIAVAAQHRPQPLSLVVMSAAGFWQEGVDIDDPATFIREHTARMPTYADIHLRTQPPGWTLTYWALAQLFARAPDAADVAGRWIHRYDCAAPELLGLETAQLAAGSLRVALLLISGLGVLPLYAIGRRFYPPAATRLGAVGFAFLPALLVFAGRFDVAYALLGLVGLWLGLRAVHDGDRAAAILLAVLLAGASFLSFTALPVALLILVMMTASAHRQNRAGALRRLLWTAGGIGAAVLVLWGALWLALDVNGLAMWRVSQAIHREYRLNYPAWFVFNLYDLAVFMGIIPFVGALGAAAVGLRRGSPGRWVAVGWAATILLLNLSATVRAETGRLWLFVMPLGLLIGLAYFAVAAGETKRGRDRLMLLFGVFLVQALVTGTLLGGRAGEPATPAPQWRLPQTMTPVDYRLGDSVALRGYEVSPVPDGLRLTLYWRALDFPRAEYSAFVHALDETGAIIAQSDGPPAVPMWCWVPGEVVRDERLLVAPAITTISLGLYDPYTGVRLTVAPPAPEERILLPVAAE